MGDAIERLTAARFDGPQALFTEAVRLLSERPALPDDLAGLVDLMRKKSAEARADFAETWADAQYTGERPDLEPITVELTVERIEEAADAIEALAVENARLSASEPQCAVVKPLVWRESYGDFRAETQFGDYVVMGKILRLPTAMRPEIVCADTEAAKAAAQSDFEARILYAITIRPEADVRAEAWAAAIEAAATLAHRKRGEMDTPEAIRAMLIDDASAALDRIKAEAETEGMREAARIAKSRAGSPDYEPPSPYDRGYAAAVAAVERAILAAIPEVCK